MPALDSVEPGVAPIDATGTEPVPHAADQQQYPSVHPSYLHNVASYPTTTAHETLQLMDDTAHPQLDATRRAATNPQQPNTDDESLTSKSHSVDGRLNSATADFHTANSREVITDDDSKGGKKKSRVSRAERLTVEQAAWVKEKFNLPSDELFIASFSAALVKHILLHGKIHITSSSICFYAKILGRVTKESFPFTSMARVKKRKGGFIANAIKIYFLDPNASSVVIGSLNQRERTFNIIQARLRELNPAAAQPRDGDDNASGASAQADSEDRSVDDDDCQEDPASKNHFRKSDEVLQARPPLSANSFPPVGRRSANMRRAESDTASERSWGKSSDADTVPGPDTDATASASFRNFVWKTSDDVCDSLSANAFEKKTERARTILNASVIEVFNILFVGDWLRHYHEASNNKDLTISDWTRGEDDFMTRELTFRRPLGYKIGPKETRVKERQKYSFTSDGAVIIELQGQNLDAPYADYFVVETFFELKPYEDGSLTLLIASVAVHFFKSTILRGKIESGALSETKNAYQRLMSLARERIDEYRAVEPSLNNGNKCSIDGKEPNVCKSSIPTTRQRGIEENAAPAVKINGVTAGDSEEAASGWTEITTADEDAITKTGTATAGTLSRAMREDKALSASVEVRDSPSTKWLRTLEIGALIVVCVLLIAVLALLNKMHNNVMALEKLVLESRLSEARRC